MHVHVHAHVHAHVRAHGPSAEAARGEPLRAVEEQIPLAAAHALLGRGRDERVVAVEPLGLPPHVGGVVAVGDGAVVDGHAEEIVELLRQRLERHRRGSASTPIGRSGLSRNGSGHVGAHVERVQRELDEVLDLGRGLRTRTTRRARQRQVSGGARPGASELCFAGYS